MNVLGAALTGFGLGAGLIIAIGAQNAFVLRQGLVRQHVFTVCLICALCDAVLIMVGTLGFGALVASTAWLKTAAIWGGVGFLAVYGLIAFRRALTPHRLAATSQPAAPKAIIATTLAVSLLNPHVYLDTVVFIGSLAGQYDGAARLAFGGGAVVASFTWFFGLGYGARLLAPAFAKPAAWRALDIGIGIIMWTIGWQLLALAEY